MSYRVTLYMVNGAQISTSVKAADTELVRRELGDMWRRGVTKGSITILGDPVIALNPGYVMAVTTQAEN